MHWDSGMKRLKVGWEAWNQGLTGGHHMLDYSGLALLGSCPTPVVACRGCQMLPRKLLLEPVLLAKNWGMHFERSSDCILPG